MHLLRYGKKSITKLVASVEGMQKELSTSMEVLKLDNLNTIHGLKSVTENVKHLSRRIEEKAPSRPPANERRKTKEVEELRTELDMLKRQQELREIKVKRTPKIGNIREFCPKTESECISSSSGKKHKGRNFGDIKPIHIREFRLDSSISQVARPLDLLNDPAVKAQWESNDSSIKTPNKKDIGLKNAPEFKNFLEDDKDDAASDKTPVKNSTLANVRDFDDFKCLLKDLKVTLNMSDFSSFQENFNEQIVELEKVMTDYSELDKKIIGLAEGKSARPRLNNSLYDNDLNGLHEKKRSRSVKYKAEASDKYMKELEALKHSSKISQYHIKLKDLKNNPFDFDSFIFRVKKELNQRKQKFEEIREFVA